MRRLRVRLTLMTATLSLLLVLVWVVGGTAANPLVGTFTETILHDGQMQVCWHEICPGQTTVDEAKAILNADTALSFDSDAWERDKVLCWNTPNQSSVSDLDETTCLEGENDQIESLNLHFPKIYYNLYFYSSFTTGGKPMRSGELLN